ncbi:hypothetical protein PUN28_019677 [Cardiocondyla obscurior]|uniref:Uncharacterized protein n=1 Tax=Cardiocondyla obscurior TaxID=286306 RepID=A0AAW2EFU9_9HYME
MFSKIFSKQNIFYRAIEIIQDTYSVILLSLFIYFAILFAFYGFRLISCNKIYYAAYSNKWYTMNPKVAEDLLLIMTRGSKPIYLTVGKVCPVTMATFCSLIKTSLGYISVLHTARR